MGPKPLFSNLESLPCPECSAGRIRDTAIAFTTEFRGKRYMIPNADVKQCCNCGTVFGTSKQRDALRRRAADLFREEAGLLTGADMAAFRNQHHLTQARLERKLGAPAKSVARWEIGSVLQSRTVDTFLRVLMAHPALLRELPLRGVRRSSPRSSGQAGGEGGRPGLAPTDQRTHWVPSRYPARSITMSPPATSSSPGAPRGPWCHNATF